MSNLRYPARKSIVMVVGEILKKADKRQLTSLTLCKLTSEPSEARFVLQALLHGEPKKGLNSLDLGQNGCWWSDTSCQRVLIQLL